MTDCLSLLRSDPPTGAFAVFATTKHPYPSQSSSFLLSHVFGMKEIARCRSSQNNSRPFASSLPFFPLPELHTNLPVSFHSICAAPVCSLLLQPPPLPPPPPNFPNLCDRKRGRKIRKCFLKLGLKMESAVFCMNSEKLPRSAEHCFISCKQNCL